MHSQVWKCRKYSQEESKSGNLGPKTLVSYDSQKYVKKHWWVIIWWVTIDYTIPDLIDLFDNDCKVVRK